MAVESQPFAPSTTARTIVARSEAEVEDLRRRWEQLPITGLDGDPDWLLALCRARVEVERPHVLLLERPGRPDLLIVGRLERVPLESRVGYMTVARPRVRCLFVGEGGIIGVQDEADRRSVVDALRAALSAGEADVVTLANLDVEDPLYDLARMTPARPFRDSKPEAGARRTAELHADLDGFLKARSKNTRDNVKRYSKKFLKAHGDEVEVRLYTDVADLDVVCRDLDVVASKTYQRGLGVGFTGNATERTLMTLGMERDWFRAWVLYVAGTPVAFWHGYLHRGTFGTGSPGFDPAFADYRVGNYLLMRAIESLSAEGAEVLDFGTGDAQYKRSYGDSCREQATVMLFATTPRMLFVNVRRTAISAAARLLRRLAEESEAGRRLKKAWRDRLAKRSSATSG